MRCHALSASLLLIAALVLNADQRGEWTMGPGESADTVTFSVHYTRDANHDNSSSSAWRKENFVGLDFTGNTKRNVHFSIKRDAGTLDCEGLFEATEGAGLFTFHPHPEYARQMAAMGFEDMSDDSLLAAALHDVSLSFARAMRAKNIEGLKAHELIALRVHGVTPDYVQRLQAHGLPTLTARQIIRLRNQGID